MDQGTVPRCTGETVENAMRRVLICGHRQDHDDFQQMVETFHASGCEVAFWRSSESNTIRFDQFDFLWVQSNDGSIVSDDAIAIGMAHALNVPAFGETEPHSAELRKLVTTVPDPKTAIRLCDESQPQAPALGAFQHYYARVAVERGYAKEGAKECLVLLMEEVGELARAIRKSEGLVRHGSDLSHQGHELADVFLYVIHMANILDIDLGEVVREKEVLNAERARAALRHRV